MKKKIAKILSNLTNIREQKVVSLIEIPPSPELGDYAFPCFPLANKLKKSPNEIAQLLVKRIPLQGNFEKVEAKGSYLNFFLSRSSISDILKRVLKERERYGSSFFGKGKKALVEHTSINPNASPHIGRARNALIGDSIVKILEFQGFDVETHYFVNDVGKQIAMLVLSSENKKNLKFSNLLGLYIKINKEAEKNQRIEQKAFALLRELEQGNKKILAKFKKIVKMCLAGQLQILSKLKINFDYIDYESDYLLNKKTQEILIKLKKTGKLFEDKEGRLVLNQEGCHLPLKSPVFVLTRSDKTSLYQLRDIVYTIDKIKRSKNYNYVVLGEDQKTYFQQLKIALGILGFSAPRAIHYSFVLLQNEKMSTRKGNIVLLEDFFNEVEEKVSLELKKRYNKIDREKLEKISIAVVKYSILKVAPMKNVFFNLNEALSFEGNTGTYLLYTYTRAKSILRKAKKQSELKKVFITENEKKLILFLNLFPEIIEQAWQELSPSIIANYVFALAQKFNDFYHSYKVIGSENEQSRLFLVEAVSIVLKNALSLLGIETLEEM